MAYVYGDGIDEDEYIDDAEEAVLDAIEEAFSGYLDVEELQEGFSEVVRRVRSKSFAEDDDDD
jgi:hypothetical protein